MRSMIRLPGRRSSVVIVLTVLLSACSVAVSAAPSSNPSPSSAPVVTPLPSPSPSPDTAALFLAKYRGMTSAALTLSADLERAGVPLELRGNYEVAGANDHWVLWAGAAGSVPASERETWAGTVYERTGDGPWYQVSAATPSVSAAPSAGGAGGIGSFVTSLVGVKDMGVEVKAGQQLHRLSADGVSIEPVALGIDGTGTVTLDVYARDDGSPVLMEFTLDLDTGTTAAPEPLTGTLDLAFEPTMVPVITAPTPVWVVFTSEKGYSLGHPADWARRDHDGWESFEAPREEMVGVVVEPDFMSSLAAFDAAHISVVETTLGAQVASDETISLDGVPAHRITYMYQTDAGLTMASDVVAVRDKTAVLLSWVAVPDSSPGFSLSNPEWIIASFKFTE
jgi:hypothetical protein